MTRRNLRLIIFLLAFLFCTAQIFSASYSHNFDFKETPLREAFRLIGKVFRVGVLMDDSVNEGELITLTLSNVTCDQAFEFLTRLKGLRYKKYNNIYVIGTEKALTENFEYTTTRLFKLSNISAKDVAAEIAGIVEGDKIKADEVTNSIVVTASELQLKNIREIIDSLDIPPPVVSFDVRIEELSSSASKTLGFEFNLDRIRYDSNAGMVRDYVAALKALEQEGSAKVRARPNFAVLNNMTGTFRVISQIPILSREEVDESGNIKRTYEFKDVGIKLNIKPRVNRTNDITITMTGELSNIGVYTVGALVSIDIREVQSTIQVPDGQTFVICGMLWEDTRTDVMSVPILGKLPLLGRLFQRNNEKTEVKELVFFITPRIVRNTSNLREKLNINPQNETTTIETIIPFNKAEEESTIVKDEMQKRLEELLEKNNAADRETTPKPQPSKDNKTGVKTPEREQEKISEITPTPLKPADSAPAPTPGPSSVKIPEKAPAGKTVFYKVKPKDTVFSIAKKFGVEVDKIKKENNINASNNINVGQVLKIPIPPDHIYYVKKGDTLYSIARKYKTTVAIIMEINGLTGTTIEIGQEIILPTKVDNQ